MSFRGADEREFKEGGEADGAPERERGEKRQRFPGGEALRGMGEGAGSATAAEGLVEADEGLVALKLGGEGAKLG